MPRSNDSSNTLSVSAATRHYRMPAEWEPHAATWLAWPHYHGDWPGKFEPIPWVYTEIIRNLARHERVELIVNDAAAERQVRKLLSRADAALANVRFHRWPTNRVWMRDSGCIFVAHPPAVGEPAVASDVCRPRVRSIEQLAHLPFSRRIIDDQFNALMPREISNDLGIDPRNRLEPARPVAAIVRPCEPGCIVRLPLSRHPIAEGRGRL